jgi:hypothetical protein
MKKCVGTVDITSRGLISMQLPGEVLDSCRERTGINCALCSDMPADTSLNCPVTLSANSVK